VFKALNQLLPLSNDQRDGPMRQDSGWSLKPSSNVRKSNFSCATLEKDP